MSPQDKESFATAIKINAVGVLILLGGVFGSYKVNEWRIGRLEQDFSQHCFEQKEDVKSIIKDLKKVSDNQIRMMTILDEKLP